MRLALAVSRVGMLAGGLRVALGLRRFFASLGVLAFAMMFGSRPMALRGVFMMFSRLGMSFLRHFSFPWFSVAMPSELGGPRHRSRSDELPRKQYPGGRGAACRLEHKHRERVFGPGNPTSRRGN